MPECVRLYKELATQDLTGLPDSTKFAFHFLGGFLNADSNYEASGIFIDTDKSISHYLEAKSLCENSLGTHSKGYMRIMIGLGQDYIDKGQFNDALAIFQEGIVKSMYVRGTFPIAFSRLMSGVAECYEYKGWLNEVYDLLSDAWSFWKEAEGPFQTYSYYPLELMQDFFLRYDKYDKALQVNDTILEYIAKRAGVNHYSMAEELYMRGNISYKMRNNTDAVDAYRRGLNILRQNKSEEDKLTRLLYANLLDVLCRLNDAAGSDIVLDEIKVWGHKYNDSEIFKNSVYSAAEAFNQIGNYSQALEIISKIFELQLNDKERSVIEKQRQTIQFNKEVTDVLPQLENQFKTLGTGITEWFEIGYKLASAYYFAQNYEKSRSVLNEMYQAINLNKSIGADYYLWVLNNLYGLSLDTEEFQAALRFATEKWEYLSQLSDVPDVYRYNALNDLVVAKMKSNTLDGIDSDLEKIENFYRVQYGEMSSEYATYLHNRGRAYQLQNKLGAARQGFLDALALQIKLEGKPLPCTVTYLTEVEKQILDEELDF